MSGPGQTGVYPEQNHKFTKKMCDCKIITHAGAKVDGKWMDKVRRLKSAGNFAAKKTMEEKMNASRRAPDFRGGEKDLRLLGRALDSYEALREFRAQRERCKRFTYGDQWNDTIIDRGVRVREEDYIRSQGNMPLKNNLIRRLVRNVLGVYRNRWRLPVCLARDPSEAAYAATLNTLLRYNVDANRLVEMYARTMEEFLISGMAVHKKWFGRKGGRTDCWTDRVSPADFFFDADCRDFRGDDATLVGEIHDLGFEQLCATFARTPDDIEAIRALYGLRGDAAPDLRCRVYEVWERRLPMRLRCHDRSTGRGYSAEPSALPSVEAENRRRREAGVPPIETRWQIEDEWRYAFLTPEGDVLDSGISPYAHGGHPYVFKAYPFIDGEIHSFVNDIIDQQKLTNRLVSMYDWILRASAKGVLLFPEGCLPDGVDINDVADEWGRFNGVIVYRPRAGVPLPQQVSSKSADIGITDLLEIQMKMMEDISGVNGALQGKLDSSSMSGTLYDQQTRNSITALADLLGCFDDFVTRATSVDACNIRQFYTPRRIEAIAGRHPGLKDSFSAGRDFFRTAFDFTFNDRERTTSDNQ